jgi:hypothetical protein
VAHLTDGQVKLPCVLLIPGHGAGAVDTDKVVPIKAVPS